MSVEMDDDLTRTAGAETTAAEEAKGVSLLKQAEGNRQKRTHSLFLDIPSWNGDLIAEYRTVARPALEGMIRKIQQEMKNNNDSNARTAADIDLILATNVGIYAYNPEGGPEPEDQREAITDGAGTVTYGRIGPILGKELPSARRAVMYLFAKDGEDSGVAISAHALTIARWMQDPSKPVLTEQT